MTELLAGAGYDMTGIDQSEEMRRKRRTLNTLSLTQGMTDIDDADLDS